MIRAMDIRRVTVCSRTVKMNSSSFLFLSNNLEIPPQYVHEIKAMTVVSQVELGKSTSGKFEAFFRAGPSLRHSPPPPAACQGSHDLPKSGGRAPPIEIPDGGYIQLRPRDGASSPRRRTPPRKCLERDLCLNERHPSFPLDTRPACFHHLLGFSTLIPWLPDFLSWKRHFRRAPGPSWESARISTRRQ